MRQPKKKRENSQISAFTSSSFLVGRAEQSRWHHYPEESEATASLTAKSNPGGSSSEPSFVSRIENQTVSVGRDVILGCQVKNLGHNYKVSFAIKQTMFENHQNVSSEFFEIWRFDQFFVKSKLTFLVTLF